jgi:hypothetical protein
MAQFEKQVEQLDTALFRHVLSQSTEGDRESLLALQRAFREAKPGFVYLEIGSYLGGSLQPYLMDPRCTRIISLDPRPRSIPDARGKLSYIQNTTENMLRALSRIPGADLSKLSTLEEGTTTLDPDRMLCRPDLCFVDGEHTGDAVLQDSRFCLAAMRGHGCIAYHDANIVYDGIARFIEELRRDGHAFRAFNLLDSVFVIELGDCRVSESVGLQKFRERCYEGYLWGLRSNEVFREFYNRWPFRIIRSLKLRIWKALHPARDLAEYREGVDSR